MSTIWIFYAAGEEIRAEDGVGLIVAASTREAAIRAGVALLRADDQRMVEEDNAIPDIADCDIRLAEPDAYWQDLADRLSLGNICGQAYHETIAEWLFVEQTELAS